ncbi:N-acetylmuramoyl-L-alanine amidase [Pseudomonas sp. IAC-BECa141]|uniref:N-acetylmuramoyl-L-alanine amidase n=1 Tax=Pseudomonas sp. IAC-BECa141 TaxID=2793103 RepID=UPI001D06042A|nr:N-acetylmuramoyl-L-alanine amidase [Pseudomonas sp. IAC-BECa141]UDI93837.1 N-acetylmuramoyl-L-alanine amidase [Pseudomonas sp. IAC-BECa141]
MKTISYNQYRSIHSFNGRIRFLVFHYTAVDFAGSIAALTGPSVSAHYLVPDITDPSYQRAGHSTQEVFGLVDETQRAWHAGISQWGNRSNLNDTSIGVEIVNMATFKDGLFNFPPYHPEQIRAIEELALNILARYPDIGPTQVLGHSDIAIGRKSDPGPKFPWYALYLKGVGAWYDEDTRNRFLQQFTESGIPSRANLLQQFKTYGYDTSRATDEAGYRQLVRAFQLHFRPQACEGEMDAQTAANLAALVAKYFP